MAEAIGLVASVVQLAGTGLKLSQALYQYADGVANADRRVKEVAKEIRLTSCVIEELGKIFRQDDTLNLISNSAVATANETLKECSALFGEIETTLNKSKKGRMGRLMLPFRENKMELLRSHIDKLKSTLQLLMQVLLHAHQIASNKIDREAEARQRLEIRLLLEEKKNTTKKYEESLRTFAASDSSTEVDDDAFSFDDKGSASMVEIKAIGSTVDPDSLAECMGHVRTLLESMERLQKALANESKTEDHSNHHQAAVDSYFLTRCHLDRVLLGSSNTASLAGAVVDLPEPDSKKTSVSTSDNKSCTKDKKKEEGVLIVETSTTNEETGTRKGTISVHLPGGKSRQNTVPKKVSNEARFGSGQPPATRGTAYGRTRSDDRFNELPYNERRRLPQSCPPQTTKRGSMLPEAAPAYPGIDPASTVWMPAAPPLAVGPSAYGPSNQYIRDDVAVPEIVRISQVRCYPHQSSKYNPGDERRESGRGEKANDTLEAAPEGNDEVDEVDKLLREWTTCFA